MRVECYSGFKADERPLRFIWRGHNFEITEVEDKWYSPGTIYFRVLVQDGDRFVLAMTNLKTFGPWTRSAPLGNG
jgi:hypothetical protein